jgi:alpha-tubulin suppressor-like RCC1 family protein
VIASLASGITAIAAQGNTACALKSDHSLWCWGVNDNGELGIGTTQNHAAPVMVTTGISKISLGSSNACAIKDDGSVACWGYGGEGQLGNGNYADAHAPTPVAGVTGATAIAAGDSQACALTGAGVSCWGGDIFGELGDGVVDWLVPRAVDLPCP